MSVAEYVLSNHPNRLFVQENEYPRYRVYPPSVDELENEIDRLRSLLVELFVKEQSLTADIVVEISCQLDRKLNEYMERIKRSR